VKTSQDELVFVPLGGVGEIGMNMGLYGLGTEASREWLMVDCGVTFGDAADTPGIDLIMPDTRFIESERKHLHAIVLTHAHEDHFGALLDLWPRLRAPVIATPFAARLLEAKLANDHQAPKIDIKIVEPGGRITIGPYDVEFVSVAHSIPEAVALAIRTPAGLVLHTGDWKIDATPVLGEGTDEKRMRELGEEGVLAVVADSTNSTREGHSPSEKLVGQNLTELIKAAPGRIAVTTFASHIPRIRTIAEAAMVAGREVVIVGRAMERTLAISREMGLLDGIPEFRPPQSYGYLPADKVLLLLTGSQGEMRAALARIASDAHPEIALARGDQVVFSSRTIPGNEKAVNKIINNLINRGVDVITDRHHLVHVSGHPRRGEIADLYSWLKPQIVLPVHGEAMHLHEHAKFARGLGIPNVLTCRNGDMVRLSGDRPEIIDDVPTGRLLKDGRLLLSAKGATVEERKRLAHSGVVSVAIAVSSKGVVVGEPRVRLAGIPVQDDENEYFSDIISDTALDAFDNLAQGRRRDPNFVSNALERAIRAELNAVWGKKPICYVSILPV
jgi:ribonuclease J